MREEEGIARKKQKRRKTGMGKEEIYVEEVAGREKEKQKEKTGIGKGGEKRREIGGRSDRREERKEEASEDRND